MSSFPHPNRSPHPRPTTAPRSGFPRSGAGRARVPFARASPARRGCRAPARCGRRSRCALRHLLGPHRLRPTPGRLSATAAVHPCGRSHLLSPATAAAAASTAAQMDPPPASNEDQAVPQPTGQSITCARLGRRACRPRRPARPAAKRRRRRRRHPTPTESADVEGVLPAAACACARSQRPLRRPRLSLALLAPSLFSCRAEEGEAATRSSIWPRPHRRRGGSDVSTASPE